MRIFASFAIALLVASTTAANPATVIDGARAKLASGDCRGAAALLESARVDDVPDDQQNNARAAIHFYSAMAHHKCGAIAKAKENLRSFFELSPGTNNLDPAKFDKSFVKFFDSMQGEGTGVHQSRFDRFYPGFDSITPPPESRELAAWGASSEFQLLASPEEREQWGRLRDDEARADFENRFWTLRDASPDTPRNEFKEEMLRRVRFAESTFPVLDGRGALTDRGRVFVLLGPPSRVYRENLQRGQTTYAYRSNRRPLDGQRERWIYFRPQLPDSIKSQQVEFVFITHPGYGEGVMQKEFMAMKALQEAELDKRPRTE